MLPVLYLFSTSQVMKYSIHTHSYVLDKYSNKHSLLINTQSLYRPQAITQTHITGNGCKFRWIFKL